ncbi:MAG: O-antigen ligase family protein [Planctomycetota bacterium]
MKFRKPSTSDSATSTAAATCLHIVDVCLACCLFVTPLWFGGRHDLGRLLYAIPVAIGVVAWGYRCWLLQQPLARKTAAHWLLLLAVLVVALQVMPLPPAVLSLLSPALEPLAPAWTPDADFPIQLGQWRTLSVTPSATVVGLGVLVSHALLFYLASERLRDERDIRRLLMGIAAASVFMAAFGLLQWLTSNGKLLWLYEHPRRVIGATVQGSFANRNHFAHFVTLGIGPVLLALSSVRRQNTKRALQSSGIQSHRVAKVLWSIAAIVCLIAIVFSLSRGGLIGLVAAGSAAGAVLLWRGLLQRHHALGIGCFLATALLAISFGRVDQIAGRYHDLASGSMEELDAGGGRREIWKANLAAAWANPLFGYGVGSHADVYAAFIERPFITEFTHAESGYLHTLTETGLVGAVLMLAAIGFVAWWCLYGVRRETDVQRLTIWAALIASLAASLVHSVVDFVWYIPACMSTTVLLAACALRLSQFSLQNCSSKAPESDAVAPQSLRLVANRWDTRWAVVGIAMVAAIWSVTTLWRPGLASLAWDRYQSAAVKERQIRSVALGNPGKPSSAKETMLPLLGRRMVQSLEEVVRLYPGHARAHLRLAGRLQQQFEADVGTSTNAIGIMHLRDAALASRFPSQAATMAWMEKAFGERSGAIRAAYQHTRTALALAPLQGDAYAYLANLTFMAPPDERDIKAIFNQALRVRPRDGGVLFEAGRQAFVANLPDEAIGYWKRAHETPGAHRLQIVTLLAPYISAEAYLQEFAPDAGIMRAVYRTFREQKGNLDTASELLPIATYAEALGTDASEQSRSVKRCAWMWALAGQIHGEIGSHEDSLRCTARAVALMPTDYPCRRSLAIACVEAGRFAEAAPHARWCLSRKPNDPRMRRTLEASERQRQAALDIDGKQRTHH